MTEYLLDTDTFSALVKQPRGPLGERVRVIPVGMVGVSIVTAGEARFGYVKAGDRRLQIGVEAALDGLAVLPLSHSPI